jgi:hypothetical protein
MTATPIHAGVIAAAAGGAFRPVVPAVLARTVAPATVRPPRLAQAVRPC